MSRLTLQYLHCNNYMYSVSSLCLEYIITKEDHSQKLLKSVLLVMQLEPEEIHVSIPIPMKVIEISEGNWLKMPLSKMLITESVK